jgi:hypothetical protein
VADYIGRQRQELVGRLKERLQRLRDGDLDLPRVVVLEGPSGTGKSRIIRELYKELRSEVMEGFEPYWPDLEGSREARGLGRTSPMRDRKVLGPGFQGFEWESQALPTFLWLSLKLEPDENSQFLRVRGELNEALLVHEPAMLLARVATVGWGDRTKASFVRSLQQLGSTSGEEVLDQAINAALEGAGVAGLSVPFSSAAIDASRKIVRE